MAVPNPISPNHGRTCHGSHLLGWPFNSPPLKTKSRPPLPQKMDRSKPNLLLLLLLLLISSTTAITEPSSTYIIHVSPSSTPVLHSAVLRSLPRHLRLPRPRLLYSYKFSALGFAVTLTPSQLSYLRDHPSILSVVPDRIRHLHTTHTPSFLNLNADAGIWPQSDFASDVVVGVLDTGIYTEGRRSFDDGGLSSPPSTWSGSCVANFTCNRKVIGAKYFSKGYEAAMGKAIDETTESKSPLDTEGHGTHTASTAAGASVENAGFYDYARGDARGMATKARIAVYKICWAAGCYDSDILAAMDAAIADGVDVISLSVGSTGYPPAFYRDSIAIGAYGAVRHGVLVSCSAGNSGPGPSTAVNVAPWILTVGASTIDREFPADVILGDGSVLAGVSLYAGKPIGSSSDLLPLVSGADCGSRLCIPGYLNSSKVEGKMVLCDRGGNARVEKGSAVKLAGGAGMIMANTAASGEELLADAHLLPATMVGAAVGDKIRKYVATDPSPMANIIFRGTVIGPNPASPKVAAFSSRGPNYRAPEIMKPDVIAPGVNILAAWTGRNSPTDLDVDPRRVEFNIISGTSMSCPHVSGIAALLKKAHPGWSPAAIKSALMTTAYDVDSSGEVIKDLASGAQSTPFARGSGHVDPNRALDPGLIYDLRMDDYIAFLCSVGCDAQQIAVVARDGISVNCSETAKRLSRPGGLNYPSFSVVFSAGDEVVTYGREVTNVGSGAAAYEVQVSSPEGVAVKVSPSKLVFDAEGQSLSYEITFASAVGSGSADAHRFGWVSWSDGVHVVRSPIAVGWKLGELSASI